MVENDKTNQKYLQMLEQIKKSILPETIEIIKLINEMDDIFGSEPNILYLDSPISIVGDVHGHFYDVLNMLFMMKDPMEKKYLFLGDYVDRGFNSVETLIMLLLYKRLYPKNIYLLRGNHETRFLSSVYGFKEECKKKYNLVVYWKFCELFQLFPVVAIVDEQYFCVHGGISPDLNLKFIMEQDRVEDIGTFNDILWSDPSDCMGFKKNPRGAGYLFGEDVTKNFLEINNFKTIVRSHQLVQNGYKSHFSGLIYTVWGAPNYCYSSGNLACVMDIKSGEHDFKFFDKCDEQFKEDLSVPMFFD